jgi:hypothetical protein
MKFINPKTDYAFKKIFGSDQSQDILISFLNAIVYQGETFITSLEIISTFFNCIATVSDRHSCKPLWKPPFMIQ